MCDEGSFKLVEKMLNEYMPLFSSNKFNICCDETFDLGKGRSKIKGEEIGVGKLYTTFLNKVINCVKSHDKEVMFWGDVIVNHKESIDDIEKDVICLNWAYDKGVDEKTTKIFSEGNMKQYVCPGVSGWNRIMNDFENAYGNISDFIKHGVKFGAIGVLNTDWGDFGHINFLGNSIPGMVYGAALSWNPESGYEVEEFEQALSIVEYGVKPNNIGDRPQKSSDNMGDRPQSLGDRPQSLGDRPQFSSAENLAEELRNLGKYDLNMWRHLIHIKEKDKSNEFLSLDMKKFTEAYYKAIEIENNLYEYSTLVKPNRRIDLEEFIVSAKGVSLLNALALVLLKNKYEKSEIELVMGYNDLAEKLEIWFMDIADLWRRRNKESELFRLRDVIIHYAKYLRSL